MNVPHWLPQDLDAGGLWTEFRAFTMFLCLIPCFITSVLRAAYPRNCKL